MWVIHIYNLPARIISTKMLSHISTEDRISIIYSNSSGANSSSALIHFLKVEIVYLWVWINHIVETGAQCWWSSMNEKVPSSLNSVVLIHLHTSVGKISSRFTECSVDPGLEMFTLCHFHRTQEEYLSLPLSEIGPTSWTTPFLEIFIIHILFLWEVPSCPVHAEAIPGKRTVVERTQSTIDRSNPCWISLTLVFFTMMIVHNSFPNLVLYPSRYIVPTGNKV